MSKKYAYVVWIETQQKSVVPSSSILQGDIILGEVKWHGKPYDAIIMAVGMGNWHKSV